MDGRRAWSRLKGWYQDAPSAVPGRPDDGESALDALADVGQVRRLLDQAELVAVRTARRHGKSWAEIATRLGVARQSAWERWRDLDETDGGSAQRPCVRRCRAGCRRRRPRSIAPHARSHGQRRSSGQRWSVVDRSSISCRMSWECRGTTPVMRCSNAGLMAVGPDPDGPPLTALGWPNAVVTDQSPESGAKVPAGTMVTLWIERGGGSGVREPRRPLPRPRKGRATKDDPLDDAVGS